MPTFFDYCNTDPGNNALVCGFDYVNLTSVNGVIFLGHFKVLIVRLINMLKVVLNLQGLLIWFTWQPTKKN